MACFSNAQAYHVGVGRPHISSVPSWAQTLPRILFTPTLTSATALQNDLHPNRIVAREGFVELGR